MVLWTNVAVVRPPSFRRFYCRNARDRAIFRATLRTRKQKQFYGFAVSVSLLDIPDLRVLVRGALPSTAEITNMYRRAPDSENQNGCAESFENQSRKGGLKSCQFTFASEGSRFHSIVKGNEQF